MAEVAFGDVDPLARSADGRYVAYTLGSARAALASHARAALGAEGGELRWRFDLASGALRVE